MTDPTTEFFTTLVDTPRPMLRRITGTMRFDLDEDHATTHWLVQIDNGQVAVSHRNVDADAVLRAPRSLFDRMVTGEANMMTATLRGQLRIDGDPLLAVLFQRLLPGPPRNDAHLPEEAEAR